LKGYAYWKRIDKITACKIEEKELAKVVNKSITRLPLPQRTVFHLRKNLHWRRSEIALALAISPFTVKTTLQNALGRIEKTFRHTQRKARKCWKECCPKDRRNRQPPGGGVTADASVAIIANSRGNRLYPGLVLFLFGS
jgi:hypothetical protein